MSSANPSPPQASLTTNSSTSTPLDPVYEGSSRSRARNGQPRRPRVRASCNSCASLKIRCGQERPNCLRCQARGLECIYSVSKRSGRPSQAVQEARRASAATSATTTNTNTTTSDASPGLEDDLFPLTEQIDHAHLDSSSNDETSIEHWMMDIPMIPTAEDMPLHGWPTGHSMEAAVAAVAAAPVEDPMHEDCVKQLIRCSLKLHVNKTACQSSFDFPTTNPPLEGPNNNCLSVDSILLRNLDAVKLLNMVLACPCALDYSTLELGYLVASKIVGWYELVLGMGGENLHKIISVPVSVGSYTLDSEHVLGHMILEDLRRHFIPTLVKLSTASAGLSWQGMSLRKRVEGVIAAASRVSFSRNDDLVAAIPLR